MKITKLTIHHLSMPLVSPFETSFGRAEERESLLIEAFSEGISGFGECVADRDPGYAYETSGTAWHILREFIAPLVFGVDFSSPSDLLDLVSPIRGHPMAKAGLEMALWDLAGKMEKVSLQTMLDGKQKTVPVGVSVGLQSCPEELVDVVTAYLADGYQLIKVKIKPGRDVGDTGAVRLAYPDILLQVDANSAYTLDTAQSLLPLDDMDLLLIEQPLAEDDLWDHRTLQSNFRTPICLDESIVSLRHARQALEMNACRIVNIKVGRVGGLTNAVKIHDLCRSKGIPVWCGGMLETGVGRAASLALASLPGFTLPGDISASNRYYRQDITNERFTLNSDSSITVPLEPGLGVTIDRRALDQYTVKKVILTAEDYLS
jgi:O-succinylbenzoate synthase